MKLESSKFLNNKFDAQDLLEIKKGGGRGYFLGTEPWLLKKGRVW